MKNMIQKGDHINFTNGTGSDIASGDPVVVGNQVCVACGDIANGFSGILAFTGVAELPKTAGTAINQCTAPIFDVSAAAFVHDGATPAAGDVSGSCTCWAPAEADDTTVQVKINTAIGSVT